MLMLQDRAGKYMKAEESMKKSSTAPVGSNRGGKKRKEYDAKDKYS